MIWFYLDDERGAPARDMIVIPDYQSMINSINMCVEYNIPFAIDFDHDIGDSYLNGYTIARYIAENQIPMECFRLKGNKVLSICIRKITRSKTFMSFQIILTLVSRMP